MEKDYCSKFPERWLVWIAWYKIKIMPISDCCKEHDENCGTHSFLKCLKKKKVVGYYLIAVGGAIGCWAKYPSKMFKRI